MTPRFWGDQITSTCHAQRGFRTLEIVVGAFLCPPRGCLESVIPHSLEFLNVSREDSCISMPKLCTYKTLHIISAGKDTM